MNRRRFLGTAAAFVTMPQLATRRPRMIAKDLMELWPGCSAT